MWKKRILHEISLGSTFMSLVPLWRFLPFSFPSHKIQNCTIKKVFVKCAIALCFMDSTGVPVESMNLNLNLLDQIMKVN